jgi:O-antigen ligase
VAPVAFTFSRAGLLGLVLLGGCTCLAALRRRGPYVLAASALVVGAAVPVAFWHDGWTQRAKDTTGASVDTARGVLIRQALHVIGQHPLLGVGPGRYVIDLTNRHVDTSKTGGVRKPVHNVPLLAAAEGGILAGLLMAAMLVALGWEAWQGGLLALAVFLGFLPFTLLDHFAYTFPQGLAMTGVWVGVLDLMGSRRLSITPPA